MVRYSSIISVLIALTLVLLKLRLDLEYLSRSSSMGSVDPSVFAEGMRVQREFVVIGVMALLLSLVGFRHKARFHKPGLIINLLAMQYIITSPIFFAFLG